MSLAKVSRAVALAAALLAACHEARGGTPDASKPKAPPPAPAAQTDVTARDYQPPALPRARVTLKDAFGGLHPLDVEVAATHDARTRGLMWRTSLAPGTGMLFVFDDDRELTFWMRNTLIPLDMIFVQKDLKIAGIVENAVPQTLESRGPGRPSMYVVEVPGGWAAQVGLKAGLPVKLDGLGELRGEP